MRLWHRAAAVAALSTAMVAGSLLIASPAQAAVYSVTVSGSQGGNLTPFPTLCWGCSANSKVVRFWQWILYAEFKHAFLQNGTSCASFVDGFFGPNTDKWTKTFQRLNGLGDDGSVGPLTWSAAERNIDRGDISTSYGQQYGYDGVADFVFYIDSTTWSFHTCKYSLWPPG
jgi:hypothetical protein